MAGLGKSITDVPTPKSPIVVCRLVDHGFGVPKQPKPLARSFGARLRQVRTAKKFVQLELAFKSGCSVSDISNYERGQMLPSFETLIDLAYGLGIDPAELIRGLQPDTPPIERLGR